MNDAEHQMMILMLARIYQAVGALAEALQSREVITADDLKAFHFAALADPDQLAKSTAQAYKDYLKLAKLAGVEVSLNL